MKTEFKVLAAVALAMLAIEITIRSAERDLSVDVDHIRSIPEVAEALKSSRETKSGSGRSRTFLFLGNSLTRCAIDPSTFKSPLVESGIRPELYFVYPDGSSIREWYQIYKSHFAKGEVHPDFLIIPFANSHLRDAPSDPTTLSFYSKIGEVASMPTIDGKVEFLLAKTSAAFAHRHRVAPRLFSTSMPYYQPAMRRINQLLESEVDQKRTEDAPANSFRRLGELIEMVRERGIRTVFVAVPMPENYGLPEDVVRILGESECDLIDLRALEGLTGDDFPDAYHLNERGATVFSNALSMQIAVLEGGGEP